MASATYENILREVEQLTNEERHQLRDELARTNNVTPGDFTKFAVSMPAVGAFAAALRESEPIRPEVLDAMERAIEEAFEVIEPDE